MSDRTGQAVTTIEAPPPARSPVWIVGVDGSEHARHAALWAVDNAPKHVDEVRFLTVWQLPLSASYPGGYAAPVRNAELESAAREYVDRLAASFRPNTRVRLTTAAASGDAGGVLLDAAPERGLIVVGRRGQGRFERLLMGSTSTRVATHADVPCAVVPLQAPVGRAEEIVVAIDGSENSLAALDWALSFAPAGAASPVTVTCINVSDVGHRPADVGPLAGPSDATTEHVRGLVDRAVAAHGEGAHVEIECVSGPPRQTLQQRGEAAGLLVMGARGRGAVGAALLGSVSTWLLRHANVPMVVVPAGRDDEAGDDVDDESGHDGDGEADD